MTGTRPRRPKMPRPSLEDLRFQPRPDADIRLLAAVADLMHDLERFWISMERVESGRLDRLFGFPAVPRWAERALSSNARMMALRWEMDTHLDYRRSLPPATRDVYDRARDRICSTLDRRIWACTAVWYPVYVYLIDSDLSGVRAHPDVLVPAIGGSD